MKIRQAYLIGSSSNRHESLIMTTWLDVHPKLKTGAMITLKDFPGILWLVKVLYDHEIEASDLDWHRKWNNNI